jgi:xanthine dehydrogenase small subunit
MTPVDFVDARELDEALAVLAERGADATVLAGGTDVGLWVTKLHRRLDTVIYVGRVRELAEIRETDDAIEIGAGVTYRDATATLARAWPDMGELIRRLGSVQIRNCGTIGGNIANGSPIGDSPPLLIAAGATLTLRRGEERREMPLEDFFLAYGKQDRRPGEFVEKVVVRKPEAGTYFRCYKISKRFDQDISAVLGAFELELAGGRVRHVRVCYGGMAATPKRARALEEALLGRPWTEATVEAALPALDADLAPISDMRASKEYRRLVAQNLLRKLHLETAGGRAVRTRVLAAAGEGA